MTFKKDHAIHTRHAAQSMCFNSLLKKRFKVLRVAGHKFTFKEMTGVYVLYDGKDD